MFTLDEAASIGIIGGADGPTAILVSGSLPLGLIALLVAGGLIALGIWLYIRSRE